MNINIIKVSYYKPTANILSKVKNSKFFFLRSDTKSTCKKAVAFLHPNSKVMSEKKFRKQLNLQKHQKNNKILRNKFNQRHEKPVQ